MNTLGLLRALVASYLIVTLGSTSLAKLKNWRMSSAGVLRERVIPVKAATTVVIALAITELSLATLLMLGIEPVATGIATVSLFLSFGAYRMVVASRTSFLICTCAGTIRTDPASPPAVAGAILACLIQASLAAVMILLGGRPSGSLYNLSLVIAWAAPFAALVVGARRRAGGSDTDDRFPAVFASLAWPNIPSPRRTSS